MERRTSSDGMGWQSKSSAPGLLYIPLHRPAILRLIQWQTPVMHMCGRIATAQGGLDHATMRYVRLKSLSAGRSTNRGAQPDVTGFRS